jgi:hypothetical protein
MNERVALSRGKLCGTNRISPMSKWPLMLAAALMLFAAMPLPAQNSELQQKLAMVKETAAQNKQRLQQYQWTETMQLTLKGDPKPPRQFLCQYGPDGQVQKTPIGVPPPPPDGGRLKRKIIEKKTAEMKDYMEDVKALLAQYLPPEPQKMQQAYQAGNFSVNPVGSIINLVFRNYAQPADQMTISFDPSKLAINSLSINTYMGQEKDAVTLQVEMALLSDGTSHVQQTVVNATAKQLVVTTTNSNYQKIGG